MISTFIIPAMGTEPLYLSYMKLDPFSKYWTLETVKLYYASNYCSLLS